MGILNAEMYVLKVRLHRVYYNVFYIDTLANTALVNSLEREISKVNKGKFELGVSYEELENFREEKRM